MAPEVLEQNNQVFDEKIDIYSFGIILYELISQKIPYEEYEKTKKYKDQDDIKYNIINNNLRPTIPSDCPVIISKLINQCLSSEAKKRPQTKKIIQILKEIVGGTLHMGSFRIEDSGSNFNSSSSNIHIQIPVKSLRNNNIRAISPKMKIKIPSAVINSDDQTNNDVIKCMCCLSSNVCWIGYSSGKIIIFKFDSINSSFSMEKCLDVAHSQRVCGFLKVFKSIWSWGEDGKINIWSMRGILQKELIPFETSSPSCFTFIDSELLHPSSVSSVWIASTEGKIVQYSILVCFFI